MDQIQISVLLYQEDDHWIAQGLQFDITARGSSPQDASDRFNSKIGAELVMSIEVGDDQPLSGIGPAPKKFWEMYQSAQMRVDVDEVPIRLTGTSATPRLRPIIKISDQRLVA